MRGQFMGNALEGLRLAVRRLAREPGYTSTTVLTMAVGIGAAAAVFSLVYGVLLRPLPYPDSHRLVAISHVAPGIDLPRDGVSAGVFLHYRDRSRAFESLGAYERASFTFTDVGRPDRIQTALVTPELFSVLRLTPVLGRLPTADDYTHEVSTAADFLGVLISHDLWQDRYEADPAIVGRNIEIDGKPWAIVTGVAPEGFSFPDPDVRAWFAMPQEKLPWSDRAEVARAMFLETVGRLRPEVTIEEAEADLNRLVTLLPDAFPDITRDDIEAFGLQARVAPFKDKVVGDVGLTLLLVLASAGFLLLVTWANVTNLQLARTFEAGPEIGVRRALGASERDIARHLIGESLLLASAGGLLGLGLAWMAIQARLGLAPHQLPRLDQVSADGAVVALVALLTLMSGTLMGTLCLASTRQGADGPKLASLRGRSPTQAERHGGRRVLVVAQMALALTLFIASGLMARTFWRLQQADLGFEAAGRTTFYLPVTHLELDADHLEYSSLHHRVMRAIEELPAVDGVEAATSSVFPLTLGEDGQDHLTTISTAENRVTSERWPLAEYGYATPGYFQAMGIPLLAGRPFELGDQSPGGPGAILSASLARDLFPDGDPIGRGVEFADFGSGWPRHTVVGVVGDVPATTVRAGGSRAIYLPHVYPLAADVSSETLHPYLPRFETYVVRTRASHDALVPALREALRGVDPRLPMLDAAPLEAIVSDALAQERFTLRLLLLSAGTSLFLGVIGIYGILAYSVRRRTAEIGVRVALGASPRGVTRWIVFHGAALGAIGIALGLVASLWLTGFIESLLFETSPTDPVTFGVVTLTMFGVALAASYIPARRASRVDPAHALRAD